MANGFKGDFTVLIAVYGGDDSTLFQIALKSIFCNTLLPKNTVLVVDGPVPNDLERVIQSFECRDDFSVHRLSKNSGLFTALNTGLHFVETEWTVRADADDYNRPDRFEVMSNALRKVNGNLDIFGSAIQECDTNGNAIAVRRTPLDHEEIIKFASRRNPFNHMTVAFRTKCAIQAGGYPGVFLKEDYLLWIKMLANGARSSNLPDTLVHATAGHGMYRRRGGLRYAASEIRLQRQLVQSPFKNIGLAFLDGMMRSLVFLSPSGWRARLYTKFLRHDN